MKVSGHAKVPQLPFVDGRGPCRLFAAGGTRRQLSAGRLTAGVLTCDAESWSLQSRGKSRADLWAFAALLAVEEGIARQNWACDGDRRGPYPLSERAEAAVVVRTRFPLKVVFFSRDYVQKSTGL